MKIWVELDDKKLKLAKKLSHAPTLRKLLDEALDAYIARARRQSMADLLGTRFFEGGLSKMRANRGRSRR